jgi:hypothetical protein
MNDFAPLSGFWIRLFYSTTPEGDKERAEQVRVGLMRTRLEGGAQMRWDEMRRGEMRGGGLCRLTLYIFLAAALNAAEMNSFMPSSTQSRPKADP